jgi:4-hydroxy-tetrahydrodipicolinate reductase
MRRSVLVAGICGRMGGKVAELIAQDPEVELVGGIEEARHPTAGRTISVGGREVRVAAGFEDKIPQAELLVDFTAPEGTMSAIGFCTKTGTSLVTGTTGQSESNFRAMREEKHHRAKKDSPSGTALKLAQAIASVSRDGQKFQISYSRGQGRSERQGNEIVVHSVRVGDIVGEHTVLLGLRGERIEIKHVAESRDCFAYGTLAAIKFLLGKSAGWYTMEDVLSLP